MTKRETGRMRTPTRPRYVTPVDDADERTARRRHPRPPIYEPLPHTENQLNGAVAAAEHLMGLGLPPIFALDTLRALWKREHDRQLACALARIRGVA